MPCICRWGPFHVTFAFGVVKKKILKILSSLSSNKTNSSPLVTSIPAISILWAFHLNCFPLFKFMCCSPQLLRIDKEIYSITFHIHFLLFPQLLFTFTSFSFTFHFPHSPWLLFTFTSISFHFNYFPLAPQLLSTFTLISFHFYLNYFSLSPQ